jgi:hypothetical protein
MRMKIKLFTLLLDSNKSQKTVSVTVSPPEMAGSCIEECQWKGHERMRGKNSH